MKDKKTTYALDTSSRFYPIFNTKKDQSLFRYTVIMKDDVNPDVLKDSANAALRRFHSMSVKLKAGYAWYYFEHIDTELPIFEFDNTVLSAIDRKKNNGHNIKVSYKGKLIVVDFFHAVCDGSGAMEFLKVMMAHYAKAIGLNPNLKNVRDLDAITSEEEVENYFHKVYEPIKLKEVNLKELLGDKPILLGGTLAHKSADGISVPQDEIKALCKKYNATVTSFISGVLMYSIARTREHVEKKKSIVLMVPINLRNLFPSITVRNFVHFIRIIVKPDPSYSLEDYIRMADEQLKDKAQKDKMARVISTLVRSERLITLKITPLFLKIAISRFSRLFLKSRQTIIFSNMGLLSLDDSFGIDKVIFNLNVSKNATVNLAAVTANGEVSLAFTKSVTDTIVQNKTFNMLESLGCHIEKLEFLEKEE